MSGAKIKQFFVRASKTSLLVIFLVSVVVSSVSIVVNEISAQKAQAAVEPLDPTTFTWINHVTIGDDAGNFWRNDNGRDGVGKYLRVGDVDAGCVDYIDFANNTPRGSFTQTIDNGYLLAESTRKSATLHTLKPSTSATNKNCQDTTKGISVGNPDAHAQLYYWQSKTTIQRLQGYDEIPAIAYLQSTTDPTLYVEEGGASCPDLIYVRAGNKKANYVGQSSVKGEMQNVGWYANGDHYFKPADTSAGTGCYKTVDMEIDLTLSANATVDAKDAKGVPTTATGTAAADGASCYGFSPFSWVLCPILDLADGIYGFAKDVITNLLYVDPTEVGNAGLKQSWSIMRGLASTLIVLVALIMIASQIFSFEFMTAYTIKKVLPRLVIAAILVQLSWFLFTTLILIVNGIGTGLYALITQPFAGVGGGDIMDIAGKIKTDAAVGSVFSQATIFTAIVGSAAFAAGSVLVGGATLSIILTAVGVIISILVALFTLIVRKILILLLLTLAPLALVAWILPNTTKYWDMWWKLFSKLLLMFPLIMLLFASGVIAANVLAISGKGDPISYVIILIAYFAPLFLIPATFKFAGGLFGSLVSAIDKAGGKARGSGMFGYRDRAKLNKDNSIWASTRKSRNTDATNIANLRNARQLKQGDDPVARAMRWRSGISPEGRDRAIANAASIIDADKENKFKEEASLAKFEIDEMVKAMDTPANNPDNLSYYQLSAKARQNIFATNSTASRETKAQVALQALENKESSDEMTAYLATDEGYRDVVNLGGKSGAAFATLQKRLPTAAKGADKADLRVPDKKTGGFAKGFDNAIEGYDGLPSAQRKQIQEALLNRLAVGTPEAASSVIARLDQIARSTEVKPEQIEEIERTFRDQGVGINLLELRGNQNGVLTFDASKNAFVVKNT